VSDETYTFEKARVRLEEIATQVKRKDVSLEKSLDMLEEGVRLANLCTERIDHTQWRAAVAEMEADAEGADPQAEATAEEPQAGLGEDRADAAAACGSGDEADAERPEDDAEACETPAAGADAEGDLPAEDPHAAASEPPAAEDPDTEA
jgi:exodeoxyribonuclease VII small subunit